MDIKSRKREIKIKLPLFDVTIDYTYFNFISDSRNI